MLSPPIGSRLSLTRDVVPIVLIFDTEEDLDDVPISPFRQKDYQDMLADCRCSKALCGGRLTGSSILLFKLPELIC